MYFFSKSIHKRSRVNIWTFPDTNSYLKLLLLCFLLTAVSIQAQQNKIDSLRKELALHTKMDTTRVNILNALAFSNFTRDMQKTLEYLAEADAITKVVQFEKGKGRSIYIRGITKVIQADYDQAFNYYNESLKLYEHINFKRGVANCYNAMGIAYRHKGESRNSIFYLKKAIKIEEEINGKNLSAALINLGSAYQNLGEFDKALSSLKKALSIARADENEQRIAYSLNNLGGIYLDQGNYPLALEHYKKSLHTNEKLGDSISIAHNLYNIGRIYKIQEYHDKAMSSFKRSLEIYERINSKRGISSTLNGIGTIQEENGDYRSALDSYIAALRISKQIGAKSDLPNILNNIGAIYLRLNDYRIANQYYSNAKEISLEIENKEVLGEAYIGLARTDTYQKKYHKALKNALKAKEISMNFGFLDLQKEASEILSKIYSAKGNYRDALENYQQYKILNDSLFNKENIEKIAQLEYEYKYEQALDSANIRELKLTKTVLTTSKDLATSKQKYLWAIIGILVISILSGSFVFYQKYKTVNIKNHQIITEQKLLRSQMTPHFIFNSLSVLQGMILNKEEKKAIIYLSKFSKLLRIVLENSRDKFVPLIQELDAIDNYMILQNLDADLPYDYSLLVDKNIDINLFLIPPMLIQPFIENAIEHAFTTDFEHREIEVHLSLMDIKLICIITDNGIGIDAISKKTNTNKKSLATAITKERLAILSKEFKVRGEIKVEDRRNNNKQGTIVTMVIPHKTISRI